MPSIWDRFVHASAAEFADLHGPEGLAPVVVRLAMAALVSGLIGWERERREAAAGLRTHMLVGVGAALFVLVPEQAGASLDSLSRVIQGLLAGIGFLGAGAILRQQESNRVRGLTTAASIWATASLGMAAGLGRGATALVGTLFVLGILVVVKRVDFWIDRHRPPRAPPPG